MSRSNDELGFFESVGDVRTTPINAPYEAGPVVGRSLVSSKHGIGSILEQRTGLIYMDGVEMITTPYGLWSESGNREGRFEFVTDPFDFGIPQLKTLAGVSVSASNVSDITVKVYRQIDRMDDYSLVATGLLRNMDPIITCSIDGVAFRVGISGTARRRDESLISSVVVFWKDRDKRGIYGNTYAPNVFRQ